MGSSLRRLEIGVGVALLVLGVFAAWEGSRMPQGTAALPGPGMLPVALGVLLAVCSVVLIFMSQGQEQILIGHRHVAIALAMVLVAGLLWERAGFLITCSLFLFVLLWTLSPLGWWRALIGAVVGAVAARFVFQTLLNVVLPALPFAY